MKYRLPLQTAALLLNGSLRYPSIVTRVSLENPFGPRLWRSRQIRVTDYRLGDLKIQAYTLTLMSTDPRQPAVVRCIGCTSLQTDPDDGKRGTADGRDNDRPANGQGKILQVGRSW